VLVLKRFLPKSLFARSFLILAIPMLVLQAVSTWIFFNTHWDSLSRRLAINLAGEVTLISQTLHEEGLLPAQRVANALDVQVMLVPRGTAPWAEEETARPSLTTRDLYHELAMRLGMPFSIRAAPLGSDVLAVRIQLPNQQVAVLKVNRKKIFSATIFVFLAWSLGLTVLLLAIAWIFLRNQIRPILRLARAADTFGLSNNKTDVKPGGAREIRTAVHAFNRMQERILQHLEQRTVMLAGISHDVRTPLTRLRLHLDLLRDDIAPDTYDEMIVDLAEMDQMLSRYLAFARGDAGEEVQTIALSALLNDLLLPYEKRTRLYRPDVSPALLIRVQPQAIRRVFSNILENASRYGTAVWVEVVTGDRSVAVTISDNGPGIPADRIEDALKPFYRLDASRHSEHGSVGLGLSIAQQLLQQQPNADLILEKAPQGGLRVIVSLGVVPLTTEQSQHRNLPA
jgi:two-component system, OmpR family, osmolarity sensor histidine kinase EnvZ